MSKQMSPKAVALDVVATMVSFVALAYTGFMVGYLSLLFFAGVPVCNPCSTSQVLPFYLGIGSMWVAIAGGALIGIVGTIVAMLRGTKMFVWPLLGTGAIVFVVLCGFAIVNI